MDISNNQIKLLRRLYNTDIPLSEFSEADKENISYLGKYGLIKYCAEDIDVIHPPTIVCIQPSGQAEYDTYIRDRRRWYIPVVLSFVAILISLFALYKSGQTVNVYIDKKQMATVAAENPPSNAHIK